LLLFVLLAKWKGAPARLSSRNVSWRTFAKVFRFGTWAFLQNVSVRIIAYTDAVVIALLLGMEEIALYSIGLVLADYGGTFIRHVFRVIVPDAIKAAGRNDLPALRWYVIRSTRLTLLVGIPLFVGFMTLGDNFIRLWLGPGFEASGRILLILSVVQVASVLRWASTMGVTAVGYVRATAMIGLADAALNLLCSLAFVLLLGWGIYGVAAGTAVPYVLFGGSATLVLARRRLGLRVRAFLDKLVLPAVLAGALFALLCLSARLVVSPRSWGAFFGTAGVLLALYVPIALYVFLSGEERAAAFQRVRLLAIGLGGGGFRPAWRSKR
ncbi:MAG TPA: oligosaccharide flippase family protein, partial [Phycisphaerae bacterium]|nr:oligosaccharide flippase family protein [Phycisphaerae bacterium]